MPAYDINFRILQQLANGNIQGNQLRNIWTRPNNQYERNRQGQGTQGRPSQRYQMQPLSQQGSRNCYGNISSFPSHLNFSQENRSNQNQHFNPNDNQDMYLNFDQNYISRNFNQNPNYNRNFNKNSNFNRNFNQDQNFNMNFNQNPYFNQRPNYNHNQNRNKSPNFNQIPNPDQKFEVICYLCNTPEHTSSYCNKQININ